MVYYAMDDVLIREDAMNQPDIAVRSDTTAGALSPTFAPSNQTQETPPDGFTVTCASETLIWSELIYENRKFIFNKNLIIHATNKEGVWVFESDEPDLTELTGFDLQYNGAEESFRRTFVACWDIIAQENDNKLAHDAKRLKQALLTLAKEL
ncbi:MAG: hypothetical protein LBB40_00230 [Holophagales bacterium]|jgi:hypothetical protein|nr:hypothetical protein [Holophagales bacterium]